MSLRRRRFRWLGTAAAVLGFALVSSCASQPTGGASGAESTSLMSPLSSSSTTPETLMCDGDKATARTVAVYAAMLLGPGTGNAASATHLYVSVSWTDGFPGDNEVASGTLSAAVQTCLEQGMAGLPPITFVTGWSDPAIPKESSATFARLANGGMLVTFGQVPTTGALVTPAITVDTGGGDQRGGTFKVAIHGDHAQLLGPTGHAWVA